LSLVLAFVGVIGGLIAFGLIGIFVSPVVLGVSYKLVEAWASHETDEDARPTTASAPADVSFAEHRQTAQGRINRKTAAVGGQARWW
jgi:hypothetical protein